MSLARHYLPKLLTTMHGYTRRQLATDLASGVVVGVATGSP